MTPAIVDDHVAVALPPAPPTGASSLRRWVTIAGIGLIALIIAADTYEGWQDYIRVMTDNERTQVALCRAVAEQTARMMQSVDFAMSSDTGAQAPMLSRIMRLPFIRSASLAGIDGVVVASTRSDEIGKPSMETLASDDELYFDRPKSGAQAAARTFALSRRLNSVGGGSPGVVVARVSLDYLSSFYSRINITADTSTILQRTDGVILAQHPVETDTAAAGTPRIEVAQKVEDYPLIVVISRSRSNVLKPWVEEERSSAARTLSLAALAALLLWVLRSALQRQESVDREKHRLEQELAAVQRVEALGFLAASVAHDFNNVLTAIVGYAELTRDTVGADSPLTTNIDRLLAATERARLLVRGVLTFDPRRSLSYRPTQIEPIINEVSQQVQATLPPSIDLQVSGVEHATTVIGDATEIYQVIMNLCSNAVHAMPSGGSLQIKLQVLDFEESPSLALGQLRPGRWVCLSIIDSGVGLAEEQTLSIFEPFYTTRQPAHGTGIGLSVVRNIILRMNGALDVSSRLAAGTRMTVYWPSVEAPIDLPHPAPLTDDGAGETIMVVDDERELVALTEELLAGLSYEPVGYSDGRAAWEAFRHDPKRFDAILTDERMQPMRGLEFAQLVHQMAPRLPIILMTGHRNAELDARAVAAGVAEIIDKPLRVQTLREALARQFRARKD